MNRVNLEIEKPASFVVGLGASAGGLESLERFFDALAVHPTTAFVVVQHLSPDFETMMDRLLARHTPMKVDIISDGAPILGGRVYVLPPKKEVIVQDHSFKLIDQDRSEVPHQPINRFFNSLAEQYGTTAVAIVLSGSGSDGSIGIVEVRRAGGYVMSESTSTAKFSGMPSAAAASGAVHMVLAPEAIASRLADQLYERREGLDEFGTEITRERLQILDLLREQCAIDFQHYKSSTVSRRIDRRMLLCGVKSLTDYSELLRSDPHEVQRLYRDMLIGVTKFFRDPICFEHLEREVLPKLFKQANDDRGVRVWVAGCATGEEAYSLAILLSEAREKSGSKVPFKIFATDIHPESLKAAAAGRYDQEAMSNVSGERLERFFIPQEDSFRIDAELRKTVVFSSHNVLDDPPFTDIDLICCRNLLIYFDSTGQQKTLSLFSFGLRQNGYLFLGPSENLGAVAETFKGVEERSKIFRKTGDSERTRSDAMTFSFSPQITADSNSISSMASNAAERLKNYDRLLDCLLPPTILVDQDRHVLETFGGAEEYLKIPPRQFTNDVLQVCPPALKAGISATLRRAVSAQSSVRMPLSRVDIASLGECDVELRIDPLPSTGMDQPLYAIQLQVNESSSTSRDDRVESISQTESSSMASRVVMLEEELSRSRDKLQMTVEELETSNEELQTTNEELISSNEQLQSTNEELNSVNEELHTVNVEYQQKNSQLRELNQDLKHLFASTDIATIFLDESLRIRRYTPPIAPIFELQEQDIGRRLTTFSHSLAIDNLTRLTEEVLHSGKTVEREVKDQSGKYYFLRILPYRLENSIAGVILTLTNITALVESKHLAAEYQQRLQDAIDAVPVFVSFVNRDLCYEYANKAYRRLLDFEETVIGKTMREVIGESAYETSRRYAELALAGKSQQFEQVLETANGPLYLNVAYISAKNRNDQVIGFYVAASDVSELKQAQVGLSRAVKTARKANQAKSDFLAKMSHEIRSPMTAILGFADILDEQLTNPDNKNAVEVIRRNGEHLLEIINDMLDLARIESGNFKLENDRFDARQLLVECLNTVIPKADQNEVLMEFDVPQSFSCNMCGDRRRLRQVIMNLLTNAVKFSVGGRVQLSGHRVDDGLEVAVTDNGCGISQEAQQFLFQPFCQADNSNERKFEGTGLGLTISKQLVEQMGGEIRVESELNKGSTFTIVVPWGQAEGETASDSEPLAPEKQSPRLEGRTILVIDDRRDIRFLAEHILSDAGADVLTAKDGQSGIRKTAELRQQGATPDLIITDIQMPELDGFATTKRLREQGYEGPILALSASAMASDRAKALAAGCDEHIAKPIQRRPFLRLVGELIG